jgi:hypothetical protein
MNNSEQPIYPLRGVDGSIFGAKDESAIKGLGLMIGLTKREYFAAMAMQAIATASFGNSEIMNIVKNKSEQGGMTTTEGIALMAVQMADLTLKQLDSTPTVEEGK